MLTTFRKWFKRQTLAASTPTKPTQSRITNAERETRNRILRYPTLEMTQEEFDCLTEGDDVTEEYLRNCPLSTFFVCNPSHLVSNMIIIGHVVEGGKLICEQYGGGLNVPLRGINRYRLKIRENPKEE